MFSCQDKDALNDILTYGPINTITVNFPDTTVIHSAELAIGMYDYQSHKSYHQYHYPYKRSKLIIAGSHNTIVMEMYGLDSGYPITQAKVSYSPYYDFNMLFWIMDTLYHASYGSDLGDFIIIDHLELGSELEVETLKPIILEEYLFEELVEVRGSFSVVAYCSVGSCIESPFLITGTSHVSNK